MIYGRVYKVVHKNVQDKVLYIGATQLKLNKRWGIHKSHSTKTRFITSRRLYKYISDNGGPSNFMICVVEGSLFENRREMLIREEHFRAKFNPPLNMRACSRGDITEKEYQDTYHQIHKVRIAKQRKLNYKAIYAQQGRKVKCECGITTRNDNIKNHRTSKRHIKIMKIKCNAVKLIDELLKQININDDGTTI